MFFKKKPTEEQMLGTVLLASQGLYLSGYDVTVSQSSPTVMRKVIQNLYSHKNLKTDAEILQATYIAVNAVIIEGKMIAEFCEFREKNPGASIPSTYFQRILEISADFVEFATTNKQE